MATLDWGIDKRENGERGAKHNIRQGNHWPKAIKWSAVPFPCSTLVASRGGGRAAACRMGRFSVRSSACRPFAEISNLVIFSYRMAKWRVMLLECGGPLDAHWRDSGGRETGLTDSESNISLPRAVRQSSLRLLLPHRENRENLH